MLSNECSLAAVSLHSISSFNTTFIVRVGGFQQQDPGTRNGKSSSKERRFELGLNRQIQFRQVTQMVINK